MYARTELVVLKRQITSHHYQSTFISKLASLKLDLSIQISNEFKFLNFGIPQLENQTTISVALLLMMSDKQVNNGGSCTRTHKVCLSLNRPGMIYELLQCFVR